MYKLPNDFDKDTLVGRQAELISFTENQLSLHFDGSISLTIESAFSFGRVDSPEAARVQSIPVSSSDLMLLLGLKVLKVMVLEQSTLILLFEHEYEFRCYDDATNFESYHIRIGDRTITV